MHSRAHLLIQKQFHLLKKEAPWGIQPEQMFESSLFEWMVKIKPLKGSAWEGGQFTIYMKFDEYYNERPPEVHFYTIPFHPNIDAVTGRPCLDLLDDPNEWSPSCPVSYILLMLQLLLDEPVIENSVNSDAARLLATQPDKYNDIIQHCVAASLQTTAFSLSSKSDSLPNLSLPKPTPPSTTPLHSDSVRKLSFEDYHATWRHIATSKPTTNIPEINESETETVVDLYDVRSSQIAHIPKEEPLMQSETIEKELKYGRFDKKPVAKDGKESQRDRIQRMKKLYLQPRNTPRKVASAESFLVKERTGDGEETAREEEDTARREGEIARDTAGDEDMFEEEEKELVEWTAGLNEDTI